MNLSFRMDAALHALLAGTQNGWNLGWGTVRALHRRGLIVKSRRYDHYRLTPAGRREAKVRL